ncbi:T9SS type A sorting domain-containing protein [Putridiphycobacter roseus]|nr:T9SS type A sorting domain-containing protein [Putridiphycobacter roseus]
MKKIFAKLIIFLFLLGNCFTLKSQYTSIPDGSFEIYLINLNIDSGPIADGQILNSNAEAIDSLSISSQFISDLTGLEAFTNLRYLQINTYFGSTLPIHTMDSLNELYLNFVSVNNPNLSQNTNLKKIQFTNSSIDTLVITNNTNLEYIGLGSLNCKSIDFSQNANLEILLIQNVSMDSIDITSNQNLIKLVCSDSLNEINLTQNHLLRYVTLENNFISEIDLSQNSKIKSLNLFKNQIDSIDLSFQDSLTLLGLKKNNLTKLDVSNLNFLESLDCDSNHIKILNLQHNPVLRWINCASNNLEQLNVQNGNNHAILIDYEFDTRDNPNLTCIQVDNVAFSNNTWTNKDIQSYFSLNCEYDLGLMQENFTDINLFPNPNHGTFQVKISGLSKRMEIEIYNTIGQKIYHEFTVNSNCAVIETNLSPGIYLLKLKDQAGNQFSTFIVE